MTAPVFRPRARDILNPHNPRWSKVDTPTAAPYGSICRLAIQFPAGLVQGTGWFAGSRLILTAGHCVFDHDRGGWARSIEAVFPTNATFYINDPGSFLSTNAWVDHEDPWNDIGGMILPNDAGNGWLRTGGDQVITGRSVLVAGYPVDESGMWSHNGGVYGHADRRIFYDIDVDDGQSGAPLLAGDSRGWRAVGLHLHDPYGVPGNVPLPRRCNGGLTIDNTLSTLLADWGANT